jgi:hypothetical protein
MIPFFGIFSRSIGTGGQSEKRKNTSSTDEQENRRLTFTKIKSALGRFRQGVSALEIMKEFGWEVSVDKE